MTLITLNNEPLPDIMQAVVLEKPFQLKYTKIPVWPLEEYIDSDILLIKVKACGICGSDFRYYQGENPWSQHTVGIHINNPPNIILGHEFAGEVVAVLNEENRKWLGKRVVPVCSKVCGKCIYCKTNRRHLCEDTIHMGHGQGWGNLPYYPGAYAEYVPAWGKGCYKIPSNISFEEASLMDVLGVCVHAFSLANHLTGAPILISGCGPCGNGIAQVARNYGVKNENIIILENSGVAMKVARENGFKNIINPMQKDLQEIIENILQLTKNKKIFSIFDSIGTDMTWQIGLKILDKGGTYVNLAVHDKNAYLNQMQLSGERKITTSSNFSIAAYEHAWGWLQEKNFNLNPWITRISLKNVPTIFEETVKNPKSKKFFKLIIVEKD
ncbi:MAG: zinc-binding dehydrogenase [Promethearchaeota archaeon]